jgi:ATP-dependent protease ClpP protease subunit
MPNKLLLVLAFLVTALTPAVVHAADVFLEKFRLNIVGEIRPGDAERVAQSAIDQVTKNRKKIASVWVNSPGGDVAEAIRIADLVSGMKPDVYVAPDGHPNSPTYGHPKFPHPGHGVRLV